MSYLMYDSSPLSVNKLKWGQQYVADLDCQGAVMPGCLLLLLYTQKIGKERKTLAEKWRDIWSKGTHKHTET